MPLSEAPHEHGEEGLSNISTLRYTDGQWIQNWQTPKVSADACYRATVTFTDGSSLSAFFKVRK